MRTILYLLVCVTAASAARYLPGGSLNHMKSSLLRNGRPKTSQPHPHLCRAEYLNGTVLRKRECAPHSGRVCRLGPLEVTDKNGDILRVYGCMPKPCMSLEETGETILGESCAKGPDYCVWGPVNLTVESVQLNVSFCRPESFPDYMRNAYPQTSNQVNMPTQLYNQLKGWNHRNLYEVAKFWAHFRPPVKVCLCNTIKNQLQGVKQDYRNELRYRMVQNSVNYASGTGSIATEKTRLTSWSGAASPKKEISLNRIHMMTRHFK